MELRVSGVHGQMMKGIHGRKDSPAYSILLAGKYDDDEDNGNEILYSGCGRQGVDQELTMENLWVLIGDG